MTREFPGFGEGRVLNHFISQFSFSFSEQKIDKLKLRGRDSLCQLTKLLLSLVSVFIKRCEVTLRHFISTTHLIRENSPETENPCEPLIILS